MWVVCGVVREVEGWGGREVGGGPVGVPAEQHVDGGAWGAEGGATVEEGGAGLGVGGGGG